MTYPIEFGELSRNVVCTTNAALDLIAILMNTRYQFGASAVVLDNRTIYVSDAAAEFLEEAYGIVTYANT